MSTSIVDSSTSKTAALDANQRARLVEDHFDYVWRLLRRLGLSHADADDAAQEVFLVGLQKWERIEPGCERSFLYGCALNKARRVRTSRRHAEEAVHGDRLQGTHAPLDELVDQKKAADVLDRLLMMLSDEQRDVFVLFEIEQLTLDEVASLLQIPRGTAASRLRLARKHIRALHASWARGDQGAVAPDDDTDTDRASRVGTELLQSLRAAP